jgi:hypothetical protein
MRAVDAELARREIAMGQRRIHGLSNVSVLLSAVCLRRFGLDEKSEGHVRAVLPWADGQSFGVPGEQQIKRCWPIALGVECPSQGGSCPGSRGLRMPGREDLAVSGRVNSAQCGSSTRSR